MSADLLREVGEALYGTRWYTDLARALDVSERTVRRWSSGSHAVPDGLWADLREAVQQRRAELGDLSKRLPR